MYNNLYNPVQNPFGQPSSMNNTQQRINQLQQQYSQPIPQQQPQYQPIQPQAQFKVRIVSNIDEVNSTMVDFDGSLNLFLDFANKKIYTKQLNNNGLADVNIYSLDINKNNKVEYVTMNDFNDLIERVNIIEKGEPENANKSKSNNANATTRKVKQSNADVDTNNGEQQSYA